MQGAQTVEALPAGRAAGLAHAYDLYAAPLYGYCRSLLGEPAGAAGAVQHTFIIAAGRLGGLRDPGRQRAWLYAVARNECRRHLGARASSVPFEGAAVTIGEAVGTRTWTGGREDGVARAWWPRRWPGSIPATGRSSS